MTIVDALSQFMDIFMFTTVPLYILIIITLIKNRHDVILKHSFFSLIVSVGIADIGRALGLFFGVKMAGYGWIPGVYLALGGLASRINATCTFFFSAAQTIGVFAIGLNRFTAYVLPLRHQKLWDKGKWLRLVIVLQWSIAFANIVPIMFVWKYNIYTEDNITVYLQWTDGDVAYNMNLYNQIIGKGAIVLITILLYVVVFTKALSGKQQTSVEKAVLRMAVVGFIHCWGLVIYLLVLVLQVHLVGNVAILTDCSDGGQNYWFCINLSTWWLLANGGISLFSAVTPYSLLAFSSATRERFVDIWCRWIVKNSSTDVTNINTSRSPA